MTAVKCKSGQHIWDNSQTDQLLKCCNGYTLMWKPMTEENGGYNRWGDWFGVAVLVRDDDKVEMLRIKALGPMEKRANSKGPGPTIEM